MFQLITMTFNQSNLWADGEREKKNLCERDNRYGKMMEEEVEKRGRKGRERHVNCCKEASIIHEN